MKKLLGIVVLGLLLSGNAYADDIKDFELDGMTAGDSLLNYYDKKKIKEALNDAYYYKNNEFADIFFKAISDSDYSDYQITIKPGEDGYTIYSLTGQIQYPNNIKDCYPEKDKIVNEIRNIFGKKTKLKNRKGKHSADKSGKSTFESSDFKLKSGNIEVQCFDWKESLPYGDKLMVNIKTKEFLRFMKTAYK